MTAKDIAAYIFLCDKNTEKECFDRMLFGGGEKYRGQTKELKKGDKLFLYNRPNAKLYGIFVATSDPLFNIEPDAWEGKFPWQIKVEWLEHYKPISRSDIGVTLKFFNGWPSAKVTTAQFKTLESLLSSHDRLPQFPDNHGNQAHDGHQVRSKPEKEIDDWLYEHRIVHAYEPSLPFHENKFADFFLPTIGHKGIYIEYWGRNDTKYLSDKEEKLRLYRDYEVDLIEITPADNIAEILNKKLLS